MGCKISTVYRYEALNSARKILAHIRKHPIFFAFFVFIFIGAIHISILIGWQIYLLTQEGYDFYFEHGVLATVYGLLLAGKSGAVVYSKVLRRRDNTWFLTSCHPEIPLIALYFIEITSTAFVLVTGIGVTLILMAAMGHYFLPPIEWILEGILVGLTSITTAFFVPMLLNVQNRRWRYISYIVVGIFLMAFFGFLRYPPMSGTIYYIMLSVFLIVSLWLLHISSRYYLEAWGAQVAKSSGLRILRGTVFNRILRRSEDRLLPMVLKEIRTIMRERDAITTMGISIFLSLALIYTYYKPEFLEKAIETNPALVYSTAVVATLFIGLELQCNLMGAESIGMEGRRFYIYKSAPIRGRDVVMAKTLALLLVAAPLTLAITLPVPLLAGLNYCLVIDLVLMGISMAIVLTSLGIYMGTRYPNFTEGEGGTPDIVTLLNISFMGMFLSAPFIAPIAYTYAYGPNPLISVVIAIDVLGWAIVFMLWSVEFGGIALDNIPSNTYL